MRHHGAALRSVSRDDALLEALTGDWRSAELPPRLRAILAYAEKLTLQPHSVREADLQSLRAAGLDDRPILEVVEITAYFNFVNRLADGLGVALE